MAKKRRRHNHVGAQPLDEAAKGSDDEGGNDGGDATDNSISTDDIVIALRAIKWLASARESPGCAPLLEAVHPLVTARAARYQEDAKAAKLVHVIASAGCGGKQVKGGLSKKRPHMADMLVKGADDAVPLQGAEVGAAVKALRSLATQSGPEVLAGKEYKALRTALHPLVEAHMNEENASPTFRVTCMLGARTRWPEALRVLGEMRDSESSRRPKLGAYQRWVRELGVSQGTPPELGMLDAIMRVAAGLPSRGPSPQTGSVQEFPPWVIPGGSDSSTASPSTSVKDAAGSAVAGSGTAAKASTDQAADADQPAAEGAPSMALKLGALVAARRKETARERDIGVSSGDAAGPTSVSFRPGSWTVLAHEAAEDRKPPNHFALDIYACTPGVLTFSSLPAQAAERYNVPGVEGAFTLTNVFSTQECASLIAASETIGYRPDVPLSSVMDERAQNVVLMATEEQSGSLFSRVKDVLPPELGGDRLLGLNRRWRLYRYNVGNLYRKHLDGAWPASGTKVGAGGHQEYLYDACGGGTRSRLTFIVYLNDDFEGGATTFFVPNVDKEGVLEQRPVKPRTGCASVFPHGDTGTPLLHEGSSVGSGRPKYLLRTDVVYVSPEVPDAVKEAARIRGLKRQFGRRAGASIAQGADEIRQEGAAPPRKVGKTKKFSKGGEEGSAKPVIKSNLKEKGKTPRLNKQSARCQKLMPGSSDTGVKGHSANAKPKKSSSGKKRRPQH